MILTKDTWAKSDEATFLKYLQGLGNTNKIEWTIKIVQTNKTVFAIDSKTLKNISKQIFAGNYLQFLNLQIFSNFESTLIFAGVLNLIKDYDTFVFYLKIFLSNIDSWAHTDTIDLKQHRKELSKIILLSKELLNSTKPFERRMSLIIMLKLLNFLQDFSTVFSCLNKLENEEHYYVNMAGAWLLCDCFIKQRNQTLNFLEENNTNKFIINKAVQKCRDSFRVSSEDKQLLLKYKKQ